MYVNVNNPFMPSGLFYNDPFLHSGVWLVFIITYRISELNANSVDPDKTPRFVASYQGQHCLSMSLLWDARYKRINLLPMYVDTSWVLHDLSYPKPGREDRYVSWKA